MPPRPADAPPTAGTHRKAAWGRWLDTALTERGLRNTDLVRLMKTAGAAYGSGIVSQWRDGTAGASETGAMYVARALGLPIPTVLRAAGFDDAARLVEEEPRAPAPSDEARRTAERVKADIDDLVALAEIGRQIRARRAHADPTQDGTRDVS